MAGDKPGRENICQSNNLILVQLMKEILQLVPHVQTMYSQIIL